MKVAVYMDSSVSWITQLEQRLDTQFVNINAARQLSRTMRASLTEQLNAIPSGDISIVVSGSLARDEFTEGSDTDWTLLVDGSADPEHLEIVTEVRRIIAQLTSKPVGREGTFGSLTFSHNLIQQIGGEADTNRNTTQRILLLLESRVLGRDDAYERVIKNVLRRYILEDHGFIEKRGLHHVPRFLLNDFARYWWTMAVDFAYKQRTRDGKGAAIRNVKLRMSRKLIYVSGLLTCFGCARQLDRFGPIVSCAASDDKLEYVDLLRRRLRPPLEVLAETLLHFSHLDSTARKLFSAYDGFLEILSDTDSRNQLEGLDMDKSEDNEVYQKARRVSHEFRDGLLALLFDEDSGLGELTRMYGVF